ncbi:peptide ABC transporter ATP-binding protein [Tateyamaria omphalii]|uniref:DMT family transporter n=1 Tax=Tateyamaria omphalii TaxID=299262 RepID=UPI001992F53E|nr:DMT family transporter [Tateyamaria omphalii]GGX51242.1 peptide ABC transporter ATP-binding protein [Tateyamaria omphalii]
MTMQNPSWLTFGPAIFLVMWSTGYVAAKFGLGFIEPMTFLALRFACVVVIMAVLFLLLWPPLPRTRTEWGHLAIVGFLLQAMYFGMCYMSFSAGMPVGTLALILAMQPILVGLVAPRWAGETVGWVQWAGLVLGLTGAVVVIAARSEIAPPAPIGFVFATLALIGITGGSLWEKRFGVSQHPVTANLVGFAAGLVGVLPFVVTVESMQISWTWQLIGSLAYLIIASSLIAIGLLLAMIRAGEVSKVSALFFLVPPLAAVFAWLVLGEVMPPVGWLGMFIAGLGVFVATRKEPEPSS